MLSIRKLLKKKKRRMLMNKKTGKVKQRLKDKIQLTQKSHENYVNEKLMKRNKKQKQAEMIKADIARKEKAE